MTVSRKNTVRRVGRGTILFLTGAFLLLNLAQGANITVTGSWSLTIDAGNLTGGAGSNLTATYTSTSGSISMAVSPSSSGSGNWRVSILRIDTRWNAGLVLSIRRTGGGSGTGSVSGGTTYLTITTASQTFVTGSGTLTGITLQEQLGGVSVSLGASTYTTTIQFTVADT